MRWLALLAVGLVGCGGRYYAEMEAEHAREREAERIEADKPDLDQLVTRGRFDLACPDVSAVVLDRQNSDVPILVGVQGCDRQAQYSRRLRRGGTTKNTHWDKVLEPSMVSRVERR